MIGSGHFVMIELWNGDELVHAGVLGPGEGYAGSFTSGPETVTGFVLTRLTREQVDALDDDQVFGPVRTT